MTYAKITASGDKDGCAVEIEFHELKNLYFVGPFIVSTTAPNDVQQTWLSEMNAAMNDPNLYSLPPNIAPFGSVERVEAVINQFFGLDNDLNFKARINYENCEPAQIFQKSPNDPEKDSPDVVY